MAKLKMIVVAAVAAALAAAAYHGAALAGTSDWSNTPEPYVMSYLGHPLHCLVVESGSRAGNIGGLTCDFERYWRAR